MYTVRNFQTKKELREAVERFEQVQVYQPGGLFPTPTNGTVFLEGPHYPEPHRWYAEGTLKDGVLIKVK
jgi:hypothetical protein